MNGKFLFKGLMSSPGEGAREPPGAHFVPPSLLCYPSQCYSPFCPFGFTDVTVGLIFVVREKGVL